MDRRAGSRCCFCRCFCPVLLRRGWWLRRRCHMGRWHGLRGGRWRWLRHWRWLGCWRWHRLPRGRGLHGFPRRRWFQLWRWLRQPSLQGARRWWLRRWRCLRRRLLGGACRHLRRRRHLLRRRRLRGRLLRGECSLRFFGRYGCRNRECSFRFLGRYRFRKHPCSFRFLSRYRCRKRACSFLFLDRYRCRKREAFGSSLRLAQWRWRLGRRRRRLLCRAGLGPIFVYLGRCSLRGGCWHWLRSWRWHRRWQCRRRRRGGRWRGGHYLHDGSWP